MCKFISLSNKQVLKCVHCTFTTDVPQITTFSVVERCVSYLYITWNDTSQCVPVNYAVTLTIASSGELLHNDIASSSYYNFTGLTSDMTYTITVTGRNRVGQDVVMNQTSSLKSYGKWSQYLFYFLNACIYVMYKNFDRDNVDSESAWYRRFPKSESVVNL